MAEHEMATLVNEMELLNHPTRMRRMVDLGRESRTDPAIAAAIDGMERGGFFERLLAVQSCCGSADGARALRMLNDPSRIIRGRALRLVAHVCSEAQAIQALRQADPGRRRSLLRMLLKARRQGPIDSFLDDPEVL
ncbi:MAG TPA: hypothetical protein VFJ58_26420, partial [Armatimonadota bacterium]|nr:hypothetical protein [Armatimonadota bacterium]